MWLSFIPAIIEHLGTMGKSYFLRKKVIAEGRINIEMARATAEAEVMVERLRAETAWENSMADASSHSWKDEFWTIVLSFPLILAFIPGAIPYLEDGFNVLALMPQWYGIAVGAAISAAFGRNIIEHFTNMKK